MSITCSFPTIHFVCQRVIVQSRSHWIRSDIIQNKHLPARQKLFDVTIKFHKFKFCFSFNWNSNWNWNSYFKKTKNDIQINFSKIEKWKNAIFIFQKINFLNYTFHTRIKYVLFHFNFKLKIEWHFRCRDYTRIIKVFFSISSSKLKSNGTFDGRIFWNQNLI